MLSRRNILPIRKARTSGFSNLFDEFITPRLDELMAPHYSTPRQNTPSIFDIRQKIDEENDTVVTYLLVPGVTPEQVDVSINSSASVINIAINVEENTNEFMNFLYSKQIPRSFRMISDYDVEQTTVDLTNGVLTLTTPRIEKSPQSVKLPINTQIDGKKK